MVVKLPLYCILCCSKYFNYFLVLCSRTLETRHGHVMTGHVHLGCSFLALTLMFSVPVPVSVNVIQDTLIQNYVYLFVFLLHFLLTDFIFLQAKIFCFIYATNRQWQRMQMSGDVSNLVPKMFNRHVKSSTENRIYKNVLMLKTFFLK